MPESGARFYFVLTKNPAVHQAIASISEDAWAPVRYPGAVVDPDTGELISDAEVAEVPFTAFASTKHPVTARLIVRCVRGRARMNELFRSGGITRSSPTTPNRPREPTSPIGERNGVMSTVVIGIDPHEASHTAVAVDERELPLGDVRVRATAAQTERLPAWSAHCPERSLAIEDAAGLGYLPAQQLVTAGERVVDVQPKLAARVRLLASAASSKSDPNDARSVAIVALRSAGLPQVMAEDHAAVMKVWIRRRRHLTRTRTKLANQLHAVLCELVPGGFPERSGHRKRRRCSRHCRRARPPMWPAPSWLARSSTTCAASICSCGDCTNGSPRWSSHPRHPLPASSAWVRSSRR